MQQNNGYRTWTLVLYFFPRVIPHIFFLFFAHYYGGVGLWGWGLNLGFWGWGFPLMGFGVCGAEPSGFFWVGLWGALYKHKRITLGKEMVLLWRQWG